MSKPSLNYYQTVEVAKVKTDVVQFTSIQSAIDAITDNAAGKRYLVRVHPGTYTEKVILEDYIDLIAAGGREETIISFTALANDDPTVTGENCMIKGFTIVSDGNAATLRARCISAATAGFEIEDCILTPQNSAGAAVALNATASCDIRDCVVDNAAGAATAALFPTGAQTYNVTGTTFGGATDSVQVTTAITALNLSDCTLSNNFNQDGGTVSVARSQLEAVALGTAACTFSAELTRFTAAFATADAFAHTITCIKCSFSGQSLNNAATGATAINLRDCDGIATLTNAGVAGTLNLYDCGVETLTTTQGTVVAYGGRVNACGGSTGTSFVWWLTSDKLQVMANMKIAHALTAAAAGGIAIMVDPGTYAESNLTLVANVNLVGTDPNQCIISASAATPILNSAVACAISNLTVTNGDLTGTAITVTANTLTVMNCNINGTGIGDAIAMTGGTLIAYDTQVGAGDINLSTAICTLSMFRCRITSEPIDTAGAFVHVLTLEMCDLGNQNIAVAAGATTLDMTGCSNVGQLANAGTGAFTVRDSDVGGINLTAAGSVTLYGGDLGSVTRAVGSVVWWRDSDNIIVLPSATTTDTMIAWALVAAAAGGITIRLSRGTFAESNLAAVNAVDIIGDGAGVSLIRATDAGNPIIAVGNSITCRLFSLTIENLGANNGINIAPVAANSSVTVRDCYIASGANGVALTTTGAGAPSLEAFNTEFNVTTSAVAVSGAVAANVDLHQCEFTCANMATFTGANHTFDAWDCECGGGAVTVAANAPPINMTRCNDIGAITNLTNALTLEHCTTGAITNTTGTVIIEHCNTGSFNSSGAATVTISASTLGAVTQGAAAGTITITDCSMGAITTGAAGTIRLQGQCYFTDIAANAGVLTWKLDPNHIEVVAGTANMKVADALTLAGAGDVIEIYPGTYAESNLTLIASVNLVGTDPDQCVISTDSVGNPILNAAVTCTISNLTVTNQNAAMPAIGVTANTITVRNCAINGTGAGDAITMVAGTLNAYDTTIGAGDIDLSTAICTLSMYRCRITTDPINTANAIAHVLAFKNCDFGGQSIVSAATGATTLDMDGCSSVGTVSNAGGGNFTINGSDVATVTTTSTGGIAVVGGYVNACGGATSVVTWKTGALRYEALVNMRIQDALTAGAGGEVIIHAGTHEPANPAAPGAALTVSANTLVRGEGFGSIVQGDAAAANITNLMLLNGANIHIKDMKLILEAGCGTATAYPNVIYANTQSLLWLENLWLVGDTSVADDGSDVRQDGVCFTAVTDSKIVGCRSEDNKRHGIMLNTGSLYNTISANTCQGNTQNGIYVKDSYNTLTGNTCYENTLNGIYVNCDHNTITGNTCQSNTANGINVFYDDNAVTGNNCSSNIQNGIYINGVRVTVTGNACQENTQNGIYVDTVDYNTITGNTCESSGNHGIYIYRSDYCVVCGNTCAFNSVDGINVTGDGGGNADYNTLTGNVCTGNTDDGIDIDGGANANKNIVVGNQLLGNATALEDAGTLTEIGHNITA